MIVNNVNTNVHFNSLRPTCSQKRISASIKWDLQCLIRFVFKFQIECYRMRNRNFHYCWINRDVNSSILLIQMVTLFSSKNSTRFCENLVSVKIKKNPKPKMNIQYVIFFILFSVAALVQCGDTSSELLESPEIYDRDVDCSVGLYQPHELYCDLYYRCSDGSAILLRCATGLHFSVELSSCVLPQFANCTVS